MLVEEKVQVRLNNRNIKHYLNLGYSGKLSDCINVMSSDLTNGSHVEVKVVCDYCGECTVMKYQTYKRGHKDIFKDSCKKCRYIKAKEIGLLIHGVENRSWSDEARQKRVNTNIKKYGTEYTLSNKEVRDKIKNTNLLKYGDENPMRNNEVKNKNRNSRINGELNNKGIPVSRQQKYFHDVLGGEINYPVDRLYLDIAFPENNIYIEYQGSGHDLSIQLNKISANEFDKKEMKRYYFLKNRGWKMIEIISKSDHVPAKEKILEMISYAKEKLKESSYIVFDIDNFKVKTEGSWIDYDFGDLIMQWTLRRSFERGTYQQLIK